MHKNNAPTIDILYQVVKSSKEKTNNTILRADRNVQRLIISYEAGAKLISTEEDGSVPLAHSWPNVLVLPDNKSDLARFLSEHIIVNEPPDKVVVAAGGFVDERKIILSEREIDLSALRVIHEEADTRLIVHCVNSSLDSIVASARDTDVLLLLIAHVPHIHFPNLYMMSGTATK